MNENLNSQLIHFWEQQQLWAAESRTPWADESCTQPKCATLSEIEDFEQYHSRLRMSVPASRYNTVRNQTYLPAGTIKHSVKLPDDFRNYLLRINGMGPRQAVYDKDFFSFWQLSDIVSIAEEFPDRIQNFPEAGSYFMFADHSISLPLFAIRLSSECSPLNSIVRVFADNGKLEVEDAFHSFTEFLQTYLKDPFLVNTDLLRR